VLYVCSEDRYRIEYQNRAIYYKCYMSNCTFRGTCKNRAFQKQEQNIRISKTDIKLIKTVNRALQKQEQERNIEIRELCLKLIATINRALQKKLGIKLIETTNRGIGLKAIKYFEPDKLVVEYTGEVITKRKAEII
jgi:hypothetical protein